MRALTHPLNDAFYVARNSQLAAVYLGLFLSPISVFIVPAMIRGYRKRSFILLALAALIMAVATILRIFRHGEDALMPMISNVIVSSGIGALELRDEVILHLAHWPALPEYFWLVVTIVSLLGAVSLIAAFGISTLNIALGFRQRRLNDIQVCSAFLLLSAGVQLAPFLLVNFYDRYLIPLVALLAVGVAASFAPQLRVRTRRDTLLSACLLCGMACFAIAGTRDYFSWNRARWQALNVLMSRYGVSPSEIDGGYEFIFV
jgi:hypothetical protein